MHEGYPTGVDATAWSFGEHAWHTIRRGLAGEASVHLWRIDLARCVPDFGNICASLSPSETERLGQYVRSADRMRSSLTRGMLRLLLGSYLERDPASLQFDESDGKKPRLISEPEELEFNLSHSHEWALIAIARHLAVGVDIECIRSEVDIDGIAPSIFTSREWAPIAGLDHASRLEAFFRGWVRKEAAIKLLGGGFQIPLHSIEVGCLPRREDEDAIVVHEAGGVRQLYGIDLHAPEGYCAALACDTHPGRLTEFLYPLSQSLEH